MPETPPPIFLLGLIRRCGSNFLRDLRHNRGMPSQVKSDSLKVGEHLAMTPGAVVWRDERCELIRYAPTTPTVRARPVGWAERLLKWVRRRPAQASLSAVTALAVAALLGLGFWFSAQIGAARGELEG